jgi:processive 1,2-diacylglycerol beta-glucosyltransferase
VTGASNPKSDLGKPIERVTLISASVGGGHVAAARALEQAFLERHLVVHHIDALETTNRATRKLFRDGYFELVSEAPDLVSWLGKQLDNPSEKQTRRDKVMTQLSRMMLRHLPAAVRETRPDVIVHTHFVPPAVLSLSRAPIAPEAVVITDYGAHGLWFQRKVSRYFVASPEIAAHMEHAGVNRQRIAITGIPIGRNYQCLPGQVEARNNLGLNPSKDVLLLMASGLDAAVLRNLLYYLGQLRYPLQAVIACGRSTDLIDVAKACVAEYDKPGYSGLVSTKVIGFTTEMQTHMAAADIIVGKPGGLTTSEALAAGLPFGIVSPYPIQEEANTMYLLENGVGMVIDPVSVLNVKLKAFFESGKRDAMQQRARELAKVDAANDVVRSLMEQPIGFT